MIHVTFLAHSGFLAELPDLSLLFDWQGGALPSLPAKPLLVFVSHRHEDHFSPEVFRLDDGSREVRFLLGKDIKLNPHRMEKWGIRPESAEKCLTLGDHASLQPLPGVTVETLPSTDEGAAFWVSAGGVTLFHAGDLNWWHWEGEGKAWNRNMEVNFKRFCAPLAGRTIHLAMLPLDPRLGKDGFRGPKYILETARISHFLPMHQWGNFDFTDAFLEAYPQFIPVTEKVKENGQAFDF